MQQQPCHTTSPGCPTARIDSSPTKVRNSPSFTSVKSQHLLEAGVGDNRFGDSNDSCNGSTLRQPRRSISNYPETNSSTMKVLNSDNDARCSIEVQSTAAAHENFSTDSIQIEHTKIKPTESWSNMMTELQPSCDFNTSKSIDASVFSFAALRSTKQQSLLSEDGTSCSENKQELDASNDRFQSSLLSSDRTGCDVLRAPTRLASAHSLDSLRYSDEHRETESLPSTIEVTTDIYPENSVIRTSIDLNSGSSHDRFFALIHSERSLTLKPPTRTTSTNKLDTIEVNNSGKGGKSTEVKSIADATECEYPLIVNEPNRLKLVDSCSQMNRVQADLLPETSTPSSVSMALDNPVTNQTPKDTSTDASKIDGMSTSAATNTATVLESNDASMSLESVFADKLCQPTLPLAAQSPGTSTVSQPAKSSLTSTLSNTSENDHHLAAIVESSKTSTNGSCQTSGQQQKSVARKSEKRHSNTQRGNKEQVKTLHRSPSRKVDPSSRRSSHPIESKSVLPLSISAKEAAIQVVGGSPLSQSIDRSSEEGRKRSRMVDKHSPNQLPSTKDLISTDPRNSRPPILREGTSMLFHRDGSRRRVNDGEQKSDGLVIPGSSSPSCARRIVTLDKANMLVPRDDSRIRPRTKSTVDHTEPYMASISLQLSSAVMQRDESRKNVKAKSIEENSSNNSNILSNSPSSIVTKNRDERRRRIGKANQSEKNIDTLNDSHTPTSSTVASLSTIPPPNQFDNNHTIKKATGHRVTTEGVTTTNPTIVLPTAKKKIQRNESRTRPKRASLPEESLLHGPDCHKNHQEKSNPSVMEEANVFAMNNEGFNQPIIPKGDSLKRKKTREKVAVAASKQKPSKDVINEQCYDSHIREALLIDGAKSVKVNAKARQHLASAIQRDESRMRTQRVLEKSPISGETVEEKVRRESTGSAGILLKKSSISKQQDGDIEFPGYEVQNRRASTNATSSLSKKTNATTQRDKKSMHKDGSQRRVVKPLKNAFHIPLQSEASNSLYVSTAKVEMKSNVARSELDIHNKSNDTQSTDNKLVEHTQGSPFALTGVDAKSTLQSDTGELISVRIKEYGSANDPPLDSTSDSLQSTAREIQHKQLLSAHAAKCNDLCTSNDPSDNDAGVRSSNNAGVSNPAGKPQKSRRRAPSYSEQSEKDPRPLDRVTAQNLAYKQDSNQNSTDTDYVAKDGSSRRSARTATSKADTSPLPATLKISPQQKSSPSDQSDSSSDPSLPDRDIDFVRLRIMAASKRNVMSKSNTAEISARFNISSDKKKKLTTTANVSPPTVNRMNRIGSTSRIAASSKVQILVDDSKYSLFVTSKNDPKITLNSGIGSDTTKPRNKSDQKARGSDFERAKANTALTDKLSKETSDDIKMLGLLDKQLKTRHLRRLVEPNNDEQVSRHSSDSATNFHSFGSSWSHDSSSSDLAVTVTSIGTSDHHDTIIASRRLSIRQQRLPRRHLSRRFVGSSSLSLLGDGSIHSIKANTTRSDKIDVMPQRPLRRLSQCSDDQQASSILSLSKKQTPHSKNETPLIVSGGHMSRCEEGSESSNETDTLQFKPEVETDPVTSITDVGTTKSSTNTKIGATDIALMMNDDGSIEDLFTQFSWSLVGTNSTECDSTATEEEYEQRHMIRSRIRNTPLHIAMERYYQECMDHCNY